MYLGPQFLVNPRNRENCDMITQIPKPILDTIKNSILYNIYTVFVWLNHGIVIFSTNLIYLMVMHRSSHGQDSDDCIPWQIHLDGNMSY